MDRDTIDDLAQTIEQGQVYNVEKLSKLPDLDLTYASELAGTEDKPRRWLIKDWLPVGCVASLYGDGGVGKSLLALQIGYDLATGRSSLGFEIEQCRVLCVLCEDDKDEIARRIKQISTCSAHCGASLAQVNDLCWSSRCGAEDNLLATRNKEGVFIRTPLFYAIRKKAIDIGARCVVIDNISHVYPGDEIKRNEVTQFLNILAELALAIDGAVLLLGHTPKSDAEFSGSTGWNNAVRARWFLSRPAKPDDDDDDEWLDHRILKNGKNNYGRMGTNVLMRWQEGAFALTGENASNFVDRLDQHNRDKEADEAFLKCLDQLTEQGRNVSHSDRASSHYAPKVMKRMEAAKGFRIGQMVKAMERLFEQGEIVANQPIGKKHNRHLLFGIVRAAHAPECAAHTGTSS